MIQDDARRNSEQTRRHAGSGWHEGHRLASGGGSWIVQTRKGWRRLDLVSAVLLVGSALLLATPAPLAHADATAQRVAMASTPLPRLYDVSTETGMPHLEENLRYAVVRQRRCLDPDDLSRAFWMLDDVSLRDCRLQKTESSERSARYELRCQGGHGTTGHAQWQIAPDQLRGTLDVKLGGKNMTFYQRIVAQAIASPGADPAASSSIGQAGAASCTPP
jgi:hypothetical protein